MTDKYLGQEFHLNRGPTCVRIDYYYVLLQDIRFKWDWNTHDTLSEGKRNNHNRRWLSVVCCELHGLRASKHLRVIPASILVYTVVLVSVGLPYVSGVKELCLRARFVFFFIPHRRHRGWG